LIETQKRIPKYSLFWFYMWLLDTRHLQNQISVNNSTICQR
jgi:hypothetical protein